MDSNYKHARGEDELAGMSAVIKRKKWLFIILFIIILIAGVVVSYLKPDRYSSSSIVRISENYIYYDDYIYRYYPVEAEDLWIFPQWKIIDIEKKHLDSLSEYVRSNDFIEELKKRTGINTAATALKDSIEVYVERDKRNLEINTYAEDPETAFKINEGILTLALEIESTGKELVLDDLLAKIGEFQKRNQSIVDEISQKMEQEDYLSQIELDNYYELFSNFEEIERLLLENRAFFINRLEVIKEPELNDVERYTSFPRDVIISIFAALALSLIVVFVVNYFQTGTKRIR